MAKTRAVYRNPAHGQQQLFTDDKTCQIIQRTLPSTSRPALRTKKNVMTATIGWFAMTSITGERQSQMHHHLFTQTQRRYTLFAMCFIRRSIWLPPQARGPSLSLSIPAVASLSSLLCEPVVVTKRRQRKVRLVLGYNELGRTLFAEQNKERSIIRHMFVFLYRPAVLQLGM